MFTNDLHWLSDKQRGWKFAAFGAIDNTLACYPEAYPHFYREVHPHMRVTTLSHAASPLYRLPLNTDPIPRVLLSGCVGGRGALRGGRGAGGWC